MDILLNKFIRILVYIYKILYIPSEFDLSIDELMGSFQGPRLDNDEHRHL